MKPATYLLILAISVASAAFSPPAWGADVPVEVQKLLAPDGISGDHLGYGVDVENGLCAIGAPEHDGLGTDAGTVYIFRLGSDGTWELETELAPSVAPPGAAFGTVVSLDGSRCLVGAPQSGAGAAFVFREETTGVWVEEAALQATGADAGAQFGRSVSLDGSFCAVGAPNRDSLATDAGAVYVFRREADNTWVREAILVAADGTTDDFMGYGVSLDGDVCAAGAEWDDAVTEASGSAYVFRRSADSTWAQEKKLIPSIANVSDLFGSELCVLGDVCVVASGSSDANGFDSGSAWVFRWNGSDWIEEQHIIPSGPSRRRHFGSSISLYENLCLIGAWANESETGSAYLYRDDGDGVWTEVAFLQASDKTVGDRFGVSVAMDKRNLLIGAHYSDDLGADAGAAYVFEIPPRHTLILPTVSATTGPEVLVPVSGTIDSAYSAEMAFLVESDSLSAQHPVVVSTILPGLLESNVLGDTVSMAVADANSFSHSADTLVTLAFNLPPLLPSGTVIPLRWIVERTTVDESAAALVDGAVVVDLLYGDVTRDNVVSSLDASEILKLRVRRPANVDTFVADVTANTEITAFDAAMILHKIAHPSFIYPVNGGALPKLAASGPRTLALNATTEGWSLAADDPRGVRSLDATFRVRGDLTVTCDGLFASSREGDLLRVAAVFGGDPQAELLILHGDGSATLLDARVNEEEVAFGHPVSFSLSQNVPNPFNPTTAIQFGVTQSSHVRLSIYSVNGQLVRRLIGGEVPAGSHAAVWNGFDGQGRPAASGLYLYRLTSPEGTLVKRMLLSR